MSTKFFKTTVLAFFGFMLLSPLISKVQAQVNPWPWEKELPFPWDNIEGIWGGVHDSETMVFSFEVIDSPDGDRQIKVKQVNPRTLEVVTQGLGVENNNVVRAVMVGSGQSYRMSVRLIESEYCLELKQYTVITIESTGPERYIYHFAIEKLSNAPLTHMTSVHYKPFTSSQNWLGQAVCVNNAGAEN